MKNVTQEFSEIELSFLLLALDEFESRINELKKYSARPSTCKNIELNLGFLATSKQKLKHKEHIFTLNESKVMYTSVHDRRDFINAALDDGFDNENDRLDALATLKIANSILRKLKSAFSTIGVDIEAFLGLN